MGAALLHPLRERERWGKQPGLLCPTGRAQEVLEEQLGGGQGNAAVGAVELLLEPLDHLEQEQLVGALAVLRRPLLRLATLRGPLPLDLVRPLSAAAAFLSGELVRGAPLFSRSLSTLPRVARASLEWPLPLLELEWPVP